MVKESLFGVDKNLVFRETFQSEDSVRKNGGVTTGVTFSGGYGRLTKTGTYTSASQSVLTVGRLYKCDYRYRTDGTATASIGNSLGSSVYSGVLAATSSFMSGSFTFTAATNNNLNISKYSSTGEWVEFDYITITEIVPSVTPTDVSVVRSGNVYAMDFNGSTSKIDCGSYDTLVGDKTFIAWIKPRAWGEGGFGRVCDNGNLKIFLNSASSYIGITSNGSTNVYAASNSIKLSTWQMIIATRTSTGITNWYINGVASGTANQSSGTPASGATSLFIGNNSAGNSTFDGRESNVRVVDGILSTQEIAQLYFNEKSNYGL